MLSTWLASLLACVSSDPAVVAVPPADRAGLLSALGFPAASGAPGLSRGAPVALPEATYQLTPVSYLIRPDFEVAAALFEPADPTDVGVVVAHGHFGQGKSSPEAQEIAHRLARAGARVLVVDTPGMEEWAVPGRHLHFEEGAHARGFLAAGGTSALALQLALLQRGLDVLGDLGARRFGVTGASGGAVQAFYLGVMDERIEASVHASFPPIPREARASGCACDQIPGWPGPNPGTLALLERPSLWLSELPQERPPGLGPSARFQVMEGDHSYTPAMQAEAMAFFREQLGLRRADPGPVPRLDLSTRGPGEAWPTLFDLPLSPERRWQPAPRPGVPYELRCVGTGPTVLLATADDAATATDSRALREAGFRACSVLIPSDELGPIEAFGEGWVWADREAGGLAAAARPSRAVAAWGARAHGLAAAGCGLPFVVRDPVVEIDQVDLSKDPWWIHTPGAWWGGVEELYRGAVATGTDPAVLAEALARALAEPPPRGEEGEPGGP